MGKAKEHYAPSKKSAFLMGLIQGAQGELKKEEEAKAAEQKMLAEIMKLRFVRETELEKAGITARGGIEQAKIGAESRVGVAGISAQGTIQAALTSALGGIAREEIAAAAGIKQTGMGIEATTADWMKRLASGKEISEAEMASAEKRATERAQTDLKVAGIQEGWEQYRVDAQVQMAADATTARATLQEDTQEFTREIEQFKVDNRLSPADEIYVKLYSDSTEMLATFAYLTSQIEDKGVQANLAQWTTVYAAQNAALAKMLVDKHGIGLPQIGVKLEETGGILGFGKRTLPTPTTGVQIPEAIRPEKEPRINQAITRAAGVPLSDEEKESLKTTWELNDAEIEEIDRRIKGGK